MSRSSLVRSRYKLLGRKPEVTYNPRFLDLARHFRFSIRVCTPRRANEKGKVERVIRDVESFLRVETFADLMQLNRKTGSWRSQRNTRIHRTTRKTPAADLKEEKLRPLPQIPYKPYRHETAAISTTGFITVQSNRYCVPSSFSGVTADLFIYPERIEVIVKDKTIATHRRLFGKHQKTELPGHREKFLAMSTRFKMQRIQQLMTHMDTSLAQFIAEAEKQGQDPLIVSYERFKLPKGISRETLLMRNPDHEAHRTGRDQERSGRCWPAEARSTPPCGVPLSLPYEPLHSIALCYGTSYSASAARHYGHFAIKFTHDASVSFFAHSRIVLGK